VLIACSSASVPAVQPTTAPQETPTIPPAPPTTEPEPSATASPTMEAPTSTPEPTLTPTAAAVAPGTPVPTAVPADTPTPPADTPTPPPPTATPEPAVVETTITLTEGSAARYIVQEQLATFDFPNDAIGETTQLSGSITFGPDGSLIAERSSITANLASLESDSDRRDGFLQDNTLETATYPDTTLRVTGVPGLPWPLPEGGEVTFQIVGDMTIRDQTRDVTWDATANFDGDTVSGRATTTFTFEYFGMRQPSVIVVISVDENIRLEFDFEALVTEN